MNARTRNALEAMLDYIKMTFSDIKDIENLGSFLAQDTVVRACAFNLSQIGEQVKKVEANIQTKYDGIDWTSIRAMRNRIVHHYEGIRQDIVWDTVTEALPGLQSQLEDILLAEK